MNVVVLRGSLSRPSETRALRSGDLLVTYEVTCPSLTEGMPATSVPVVWFCPPAGAAVAGWPAGTEVVVIGAVRRRFFRANGSTQSRTEVVADKVIPARRTKAAERAVNEALLAAEEAFVSSAA